MVIFIKKNFKCILILIRDIKKIITMILPIAISFVFYLHFRWLKMKGIIAVFPISIFLFSIHLKWKLSLLRMKTWSVQLQFYYFKRRLFPKYSPGWPDHWTPSVNPWLSRLMKKPRIRLSYQKYWGKLNF